MPDFWENFAGVGNAFGDFASGFDKGILPLAHLEALRTSDLANDIQEQKARDALFAQMAKEGENVPNYYGLQTQKDQSGFQQGIAQNQLGTQGFEQQLAYNQRLLTPEVQAKLAMYPPGSAEYAAVLADAMKQTLPGNVPGFATGTMLPAQNRAGGQQVAEMQLRSYAGALTDPTTGQPYGADNVRVQFLPSGQVSVTTLDGTPINVGYVGMTAAMQAAGNTAPYTAYNQRLTNARTQQVANVGMINSTINAMRNQAVNTPALNGYVKLASEARDQLQTIAGERNKLDLVYMEPEQKAQRLAQLDAAERYWTQQFMQHQQTFEQLARRGGSVGGGYAGGGRAGGGGFPATQGGGLPMLFGSAGQVMAAPPGRSGGVVRRPVSAVSQGTSVPVRAAPGPVTELLPGMRPVADIADIPGSSSTAFPYLSGGSFPFAYSR